MKLTNMKLKVTRVAGRSAVILKKHSPEILIGLGVTGIVASTVLACRATLKVEAIMDDANEKLEKIRSAQLTIDKETYSDDDAKKDTVIVYTQTAVKFVKIYGPAVTLGIASIGCFLGAHNIMKKRNLALVATYKLAEQAFSDYRKRVVEELGEEKDKQFKYGLKSETVTTVEEDENGKKVKVKKTLNSADPNMKSQYARFFDECSKNWSKTAEYNLYFLKSQQNYANDILKARGHIFLNEVYDMIGIPRSQEGQVVGWVLGAGDDFVDFGIFDVDNSAAREFVNGYERSILLDFNVDGVIYDLI